MFPVSAAAYQMSDWTLHISPVNATHNQEVKNLFMLIFPNVANL